MCGIVGQFNFGTGEPVRAETISRMAGTIVHRGPDDEGSYLSGSLGLGFRRLSILDLSPAGHQPMSDPEETVWVVFNGEIYNFRELRAELESVGCVFRSECDTEVIVHGYKKWGLALLGRLNGMFGLAIWDDVKRKLTVARDPMGIKLIYYSIRRGTCFFGSEIRPVIAGLGTTPEVDPVAVNLFLRYRYTPSPLTIYRDIRKLAPGEMLTLSEGACTVSRWYQSTPQPFERMPSASEATERLLEIYKAAVKRHLMADVPVGLLLSGGLDSGLLLGLMSLFGKDWPTFTVGYGTEFKDDELDEAAETAAIYSARHTKVRLDQSTFERALPKIVKILEEPIASSSIVPMYFVCERAREDVKVALIGQGPDELFGGYTRHLGVKYGWMWRALPGWGRKSLGSAMSAIRRQETLKRATYALGETDRLRRYQAVFSIQPGEVVDSLFQREILPAGAGDRVREFWAPLEVEMESLDELNGFQLLELRSSLPDELLMYGDKLSMAHGLEARVPYLDREVVEYVQRLDATFKVRFGTRKFLHRQVCRKFLPSSIIRRKKRGFAVNVVDDWFGASVRGRMEGHLLDPNSRMYSILDAGNVESLYRDHVSRRKDNHKILFSLVVFEEWLRSGGDSPLPAAQLAA